MDERRVTMRDIAARTGYTINTVSQALRDSPLLRDSTKACIRAAAQELGYVPNALAGSLRSGSSKTIAIIVGDTSNLHFAILIRAFEIALRSYGYHVFVMNTDENDAYELEAVKTAISQRVDGVLLCPCQKSMQAVELLQGHSIPCVIFGRHFADMPAVVWDDEQGGYLAGQHLAARGCKKLLMINVPDLISSAKERAAGFQRAMQEAGLHADVLCSSPGGGDIVAPLDAYIAKNGCPDGIFAFSDLLAMDAACCLQARGLRVPEDVRLIGYDDILSHMHLPFPLSSVAADTDEEIRLCVERLMARIHEQTPAQDGLYKLDVHLVCRESST